MIGRQERRFDIGSTSEKYQLYNFLEGWMRSLPPTELSSAINDFCKRYSVDLAALSRKASMDWTELEKLAADPLVTIGSATVNYPVLSTLTDVAAQREMTMGRAFAEAAFRHDVGHFAYPFGDRASWRSQHAAMAAEAGLASAVSTIPGVAKRKGEPICMRFRALPGTAGGARCASCA